MKKLKISLSLLALKTLLLLPAAALAQTIPITERKWTFKTIIGFAGTVINWLGAIAGIVAVIFIVIGGIRYMLASGNPEAAQAAKGSIINAVIGIIIVVAAWGILTLVVSLVPK